MATTISNKYFYDIIEKYTNKGGTATQIWEGVLLHGDWILHSDCGKLKTIIIKEVYVNSWSSVMTSRMYKKMPAKYKKMLEDFENRSDDGYLEVDDLRQDQLEELRETYYQQLLDTDEEVLGDISSSSEIPMSNVKAHYEGIQFVNEDFFCSMND